MRNKWIILFVLFCCSVFSQKKAFDIAQRYSVDQILEDIDYTEKYLTKFHPDPYRYISKDSLHAFVLNTKTKIDKPLTEMQLRFYLKQIVAQIGCGHTDVTNSKAYAKTILRLSRPILPLNTCMTDSNQLIVFNNLSSDSTIAIGDEIMSIDGHPIDQILHTIYSIFTTDGYNQTFKTRGIRHDLFKYYYSFCYGFHMSYQVSVKNKFGAISNYTLSAISSLKDTLILPKKDSINYIQKTKTCRYSVLKRDATSIGMIDIDGFSGGHWRRFFRKSFKDIKQKHINDLVIDLRDNGGGQISDGLNFLSYLIHKPIIVPFDRKPNLIPFNPKFKMNFFTRLTPIVFSTMMPQLPKHGRLRHYFIALPKRKLAFKGNVYVLVNGKSFSMSCIAASYLKYKANATIIGEETGGNIAGSNAIISGKLVLPNSKVRVFVPVYHIYHDIEVNNDGHGLHPDFPTHYSKENILKREDVDLLKVMELLK